MNDIQAEIHFNKCARDKMINWDLAKFKQSQPRLFQTIIRSIQTADKK
jgi:hypothetical protein